MSHKNTEKARIRFGYLFLSLFALSFSVFTSLLNVFFVPQASAADTQFAFYWNSSDPAAKRNFEKELKTNERRDGPQLAASKVLVKNGPGSVDSVLSYDKASTTKYNSRNLGVDDEGGEYFFTKTFYCGLDSKKITTTVPNDKEYIRMLYTVGLKISEKSLTESEEFRGDKSHGGVTKAVKVIKSSDGGKDAEDEIFEHREGGAGVNDIDDDTNEIDEERCRPGGRGNITVKNFGKMDPEDKKEWSGIIESSKADAASAGKQDEEEIQCDVKLSSPVSWFICPILELGGEATDTLFKDIVSPLLKNVPIDTSPDDPGFQAWQQFRLLGNVLLVGSLLAVVYSQAKGGK